MIYMINDAANRGVCHMRPENGIFVGEYTQIYHGTFPKIECKKVSDTPNELKDYVPPIPYPDGKTRRDLLLECAEYDTGAEHVETEFTLGEKLPEGIDSIVGGKGVYLSGGEVQRVAIARAILKDAPVIILDEVTAFADPENEIQIQAALKELTKGKTVIMIAHRLSTIQDADQILVMKAGSLVEQGTHQELLGKNGEYAHMWADYNQAIAWKIDRKEEVKPC